VLFLVSQDGERKKGKANYPTELQSPHVSFVHFDRTRRNNGRFHRAKGAKRKKYGVQLPMQQPSWG
jgi:hypothetical protein